MSGHEAEQRDAAAARLAAVEAERDAVVSLSASFGRRLLAVLALCERATNSGSFLLQVGAVRAAAQGEDS